MKRNVIRTGYGSSRASRRRGRAAYSKRLVSDIRNLLWVVTISGVVLAFYCVYKGYLGTLPWISAMVGLPWSAHGVVCSFYLNMSKHDHSAGGITFETAKAQGFGLYSDAGEASGVEAASPPI